MEEVGLWEYETSPSHGAQSLNPGGGATCGGARANLWLACAWPHEMGPQFIQGRADGEAR